MTYKEILCKREYQKTKVEDLKCERHLKKNYEINKEVKKNKFKYQVYNYLLKERCYENKNK